MKYMGDYADDSTVRIFFTTSDGSGGAVAPSTAFEAADIVIYKNNSATQKATTNGITMTSPFDTVTGLHLVEIDCSNDTGDAGFWATGNDYSVVLSPDETVDSQTVVAAIAQFSIENRIVSAVSGNVAGIAGTINTLDALDTAQDSQHSTTQSAISALNNFDPASDTVANVTTVGSVTGAVGSVTAAVTTDSASRTASQADVSALATSAALATAQTDLDTLTGTDGVTLATSQPNYAPNTTTPPTAAAVADAVWDEARSAHTSVGSFGEGVKVESLNTQAKADVNAEADTAVSDASLATAAALATAQTDLDTLTGADGVTLATSQPNYAPNTTTPPTAAAIRAEVDSNSTQLAAIVADTSELQADLANGGRLDLILDSILAALDDPRGEPGAGAPPVNPDAMTKLDYLYKAWRNKKEQTSSAFSLYDDAGTTVDHQATVSDDGTTATFGEVGAGS